MSLEIVLDNYNGVCYPGQTIAGRIECVLNKEKNLRAIKIKFKGRAETEWHESESYYDHSSKKHRTRRVRYSAEEVYFEQEYILVQGGENYVLPQGRHVYPFSYILPQQLPSSFEGGYGNIQYTIKGVIDRPWKFDYETKILLNLCSPLDLNYIPGLRDPLATSVDKNICCCWCKSGPITFDISLPLRGYCPGQQVNIGAYVQNMSNVSAENVKFKIYKDTEFISHYPSTHHKHEEHVIAECEDGGIGAHGEKSWTSVLSIPTNANYPNLIPCNIINISYRLKGKVILPCPHTNLDVEFPCVIGTVPLTGVVDTTLGPPNTETSLPSYNLISGIQPPMPYPPGPLIGVPIAPTPPESAPLLPFPSGDSGYLPSNQPPYPSAIGNAAPYPSYPPTQVSNEKPPYSSGGPSPYLSGVSSPYPSSGQSPYPPTTASAPYPSAPGGSFAPVLPTGAPYPTDGVFSGSSDATAPPSYEDAKQLKNEKQ